jgi:glucose-6-phosphate 1-epimerase
VQFSNLGSLEPHGFARTRFWTIDNDPPPFPINSSNKAFIDLILKHSEEDVKIWPHRCETQDGVLYSSTRHVLHYLNNI